jgi:hypothetical protein
MESFHQYIEEYINHMQEGAVKKAYRGLMEYMLALRMHFAKRFPQHYVSGSLYQGYMDMTYFSLTPPAFKQLGLKIALVLIHEDCRFEVWLAASNKAIQTQYWDWFKQSGYSAYRLVASPHGADAILMHVLAGQPDFSDLDALTQQLEKGVMAFTQDIERCL